jgi:hypothetical protein
VSAVNSGAVATFGDWTDGVAWSTIKVPLAIAAFREGGSIAGPSALSAIEHSDNAAAERLWSLLGPPIEAAQSVRAVLREGGDHLTQVQSERIRPGFTAFGQTHWNISQQTVFTAHLPCIPSAGKVIELMKNIAPDQQWGLARIPGAATKAGWGPDEKGTYLVRQLAVIPTPTGHAAVSVAAVPAAGSFADGITVLNQLAAWVTDHLAQLPSGHCTA